jgi:hypothetical protein
VYLAVALSAVYNDSIVAVVLMKAAACTNSNVIALNLYVMCFTQQLYNVQEVEANWAKMLKELSAEVPISSYRTLCAYT